MHQPVLTNWPHTWSISQWLSMMILIITDVIIDSHSYSFWTNGILINSLHSSLAIDCLVAQAMAWAMAWAIVWAIISNDLSYHFQRTNHYSSLQSWLLSLFTLSVHWLFCWFGLPNVHSNPRHLALVAACFAPWAKFSIFLHTYICRKYAIGIN